MSKGISEIEGSDNYIVIADDIQSSFEIVLGLLKMGYVPLEIVLDTRVSLEGEENFDRILRWFENDKIEVFFVEPLDYNRIPSDIRELVMSWENTCRHKEQDATQAR